LLEVVPTHYSGIGKHDAKHAIDEYHNKDGATSKLHDAGTSHEGCLTAFEAHNMQLSQYTHWYNKHGNHAMPLA
jgi:hypothetical protein